MPVYCASRLKSISAGANYSRAEFASLDNLLGSRQATGFIVQHLEILGGYSDSVDETNEGFASLLEFLKTITVLCADGE